MNSYTIELEKWEITEGLPTKPYVTNDYLKANNNVVGITNALAWAKEQGFNEVILPRGTYAICYPKSITTQANMTVNFNHSTLKVIYDSDNRSPFDISNQPVFQFGGNSIVCTTAHTHIKNLILIGDRADRSWVNSDEKRMEFTTGILFGSGADYSSVSYCNISHYMGDAICSSFAPYSSFGVGRTELGSIDIKGVPSLSSTGKTVRSVDYIPIPSDTMSFTMIGLGYAPATSIPSGLYSVHFYRNDNSFITTKSNIRTRDRVNIPGKATKMKLTWEGNGTPDDGTMPNNPPYWCLLLKGGLSEHLLIEYNEIHRCHRGGILIGTNNVTIRNNYLHDTGDPNSSDIDGLPTFTDFTRYAICTEDHIGHNTKIYDNIFENTRMAIATRGDYNDIQGNEFRNCVFGIILYRLKHCIIRSNLFHFSGLTCYNYTNYYRDWMIENNVFIGSKISFEGNGRITTFSRNQLEQSSTFETSIKIASFTENVFRDNSAFLNYGGKYSQTIIEDCSFLNSRITFNSLLERVIDIVRNCLFEDSVIQHKSNFQVIVRDSTFINSRYEYGSNQPTAVYSLINCTVRNTTQPVIGNLSGAAMGITKAVLDIQSSNITLGNKSLIEAFGWGSLLVSNSSIQITNPPSLSTSIFTFFRNITDAVEVRNTKITATVANTTHSVESAARVVLVDNQFVNFAFINPTVKVITSDPAIPYIRKATVSSAPPAFVPDYVGQVHVDVSSKKIFMAIGIVSISDWQPLN